MERITPNPNGGPFGNLNSMKAQDGDWGSELGTVGSERPVTAQGRHLLRKPANKLQDLIMGL